MRRDTPEAPTAIHSPSGLKSLPLEEVNVRADCLENQFSTQDLCEENHERLVVAHIQALFEAVDNNSPERARPCNVQ
jgi:hypothetical protein